VPKTSKYNKNIYMDTCLICNDKCDEVHHINEQQYANLQGVIEEKQIHKNRDSNLLTICTKCHDNIHNGKIKISERKMTSEGIKIDVEKNLENDNNLNNRLSERIKEMRNKGITFVKILDKLKDEFKDEKITMYKIKKLIF
jgi:hypothetical protein